MKRILPFGLLAILLIPAVLFMLMRYWWTLDVHASVKAIQKVIPNSQITEIGTMESDLLETPRLYGYLVDRGGSREVAVFEQTFGTGNGDARDNQYLLITPGQKLSENDRSAEAKLKIVFGEYFEDIQIESRHEIIHVQGMNRHTLPVPFYKVTYRSNNEDYLVFYHDEQNKVSAFQHGYLKLRDF